MIVCLCATAIPLKGAVNLNERNKCNKIVFQQQWEATQLLVVSDSFFSAFVSLMITTTRYINKFYQQHFVHVVSKNDIVPKVMPLAHMIYTMWAGLNVGPLSEVLHLSRVGMLVLQLLKLKPIELPLVVTGTQALTWVPNMLRSLLHRALALALSHHSGRRYSFAGHMVLLDDTDSNFLEYADRERWKMGRHLSFHLNCGSLDIVKEHALLSYIDQVFKVEATKQQACGKEMMIQELVTVKAPTMLVTPGISEEALMTTLKVELHSSTLKMNCFNNMNPYAHQQARVFSPLLGMVIDRKCLSLLVAFMAAAALLLQPMILLMLMF